MRDLEQDLPSASADRSPPVWGRDLIDGAVRKIVTAIVIAGGVIGLAIYARPGPPEFQAFAAPDGRIVRVNMRSGTVLACEGNRCMTIVRRGQRLERQPPVTKAQPPQPLPVEQKAPAALPAPAN